MKKQMEIIKEAHADLTKAWHQIDDGKVVACQLAITKAKNKLEGVINDYYK